MALRDKTNPGSRARTLCKWVARGTVLGFADPIAGIGYAYVTSRMGTCLTGEPCALALRNTLYSGIPAWSVSSTHNKRHDCKNAEHHIIHGS
jgi:hypothetical protein